VLHRMNKYSEIFRLLFTRVTIKSYSALRMKLILVVAVLGCMVACSLADEDAHPESTCGPLQKIKVKRQWDKAFGEGSHRLEFAQHFWTHFFKDNPKARDLYKKFRSDNIYSPEFQAASQRIFNTLTMIIDTADDPEVLKVIVANAKADDTETGVKKEYLDPFRDSLLETLPEYLGTHLDWDAWTDCLNSLFSALQN